MLSLPPSVRLFVATQAVDGRKGADSLMVLVRDVLQHDPLSGHLFIFFSKRRDRVRIVYWDRNVFAMWTKRLEAGRFRPTFSPDGSLSVCNMEAAELALVIEGLISLARAVARAGSHARRPRLRRRNFFLPRSDFVQRSTRRTRLMKQTPTSPYAPDLEELRSWLEKRVAALKLVGLVAAVIALIARMRAINLDLTKRVAHLTRKRPRSETLERLERQLVLPSMGLAAPPAPKKNTGSDRIQKRSVQRQISSLGHSTPATPRHPPRIFPARCQALLRYVVRARVTEHRWLLGQRGRLKAVTECVNAVLKVLLEEAPGGKKSGQPVSFGRSLQEVFNDCCILLIDDCAELRAENERACTGLVERTAQ